MDLDESILMGSLALQTRVRRSSGAEFHPLGRRQAIRVEELNAHHNHMRLRSQNQGR